MTSNTKLMNFEKQDLKDQIAELIAANFSVEFKFNPAFGLTYCIIIPFKGSNVKYISTSVASPDERKFRKSVGKFHAVNRYIFGGYVVVPACMQVGDE